MNSMEATRRFFPPRQRGTLFQLALIGGLFSAAVWAVWQISLARSAPELIPFLAVLTLALAGIPVLFYRLYALHRSEYRLERGSLHLQWGWRQETLPFHQIQWIHPVDNLENPPRPPLFRWPGAVLGSRRTGAKATIEFLASSTRNPLMIAAGDAYYVISPEYPEEFTAAYQQFIEWGALTSTEPESQRPGVLFTDLRREKLAAGTLLAGLLLNLTLLAWVLLVIPGRPDISLGFTPSGTPNQPLESVRLVLLPILNLSSTLANFLLGLFLYRRPENRVYAYLLWLTSPAVGIIFHIGLYLMIR